ncbi:MAG: hypothetical protein HY700_08440 [Gemmatimonadetes bacterium]|nr:hypothetical protein [Gemmatimonadota bacterium]
MRMTSVLVALAALVLGTLPVGAQHPPGQQGSANVHIMSHIPLPGGGNHGVPNLGGIEIRTADVEIEQELSRPYAYVPMWGAPSLLHIISLKDPAKAKILYTWTIENPELHRPAGGLAPSYFKTHGRYYLVNGFQFGKGGPDNDLGAVVWDVTGLPDTTTIKEAGRVRLPEVPGGFHETFTYKHSSGAPLLVVTTASSVGNIYDMDKFLAKAPNQGLVGRVPIPDSTGYQWQGYHDFYVAYDPATHQDKLYGAGWGGYYVYDITDLANPKLITSITGMAGITFGHSIQATPEGRYAVVQSEYQWAPIRIVDLKPGLEGTVKNISRPIGAWTASWDGNPHNYEVRWPYVFVAAFEDGFHVFNMMDPTNPYTVGFYDTYDKPKPPGAEGNGMVGGMPGGWGADVRNADGLIVISDMLTGFWAFKMDGFDGWNGHQWGLPNVSSAQDWDNGPEGAPKPARVS